MVATPLLLNTLGPLRQQPICDHLRYLRTGHFDGNA